MFDLSDLLRWCETEKKTLATVDGFVDLSTPVGPLLVTVVVWAAQEERRLIIERTREARVFARLNGNYVLVTAPYGYRAVRGEDRKLRFAEDPEQAEVICHIAGRILDGVSVYAVCAELNTRGVDTPAVARAKRRTVERPDRAAAARSVVSGQPPTRGRGARPT
jgi:DNA invertase Pin-like site-specific DNA recombinase